MTRITFTCALVFIAFGVHQGVMADKPKLIPEDEEIRIKEGDELKLKCQGAGELQFSKETVTGDFERSKSETSYDSWDDMYIFTIPRAHRTDTGWYACAESGIEIKNNDQIIDHSSEDISWIFVYVNSKEPFAVMEAVYDTVLIVAGSDGVIPCRTTLSSEHVVLEINGGSTPKPEDTTYDPKIGFILKEVGYERNGETYSCKYDEINDGDEQTWPFYYLTVTIPNPVKKITIDQGTKHVVSGQDMILQCIVVTIGTIDLRVNWKTPESVQSERERVSKMEVLSDKNHDVTCRVNLTIKNVEESDSGKYTCIATDTSGDKTEASKNITIWNSGHNYINVNVDGQKDITSNEKGVAQWKIYIESYPEEYSFKWLKPDGKTQIDYSELSSDNGKYSHDHKNTPHIFKISQLGIRDSGNYAICVSTSNDTKCITLSLTVEAPPRATIERPLSRYVRKQRVDLYCNILASPLPNVTWQYIEYPDFPSKEHPIARNISKKVINKMVSPFQLRSHLNITVDRSADVICESCNKFDCTEVTEFILVSDPTIFTIRGPERVAEGDNVTLICEASRDNFTEQITWEGPYSDELGISDTENSRQFFDGTAKKVQKILEILNVTKSDSGVYSCQAEGKTTRNKTENHTLEVLSARLPVINMTNLNNSKIFIKHKDINKNMTLTCFADGMPVPKVTWYRDNHILSDSNPQYSFGKGNFTFQILLFRETDGGRYSCLVESRLGNVTRYFDIEIEERSHSQSTILWISLIGVLITIIIIVITYMGIKVHRERLFRKELLKAGLTNFEEGALECINPELTLDDQVELLPYDKKWEFPRDRLKLGKQLGSGAFGVVMKAEAQGICVEGEVTTVAVKMVRRSADLSYMKALSNELKIMIHLGRHINVVNLLGACTKTILTKRELYVIVEYCRYGNLHNYLQRQRTTFIDQIDIVTRKIDPNFGVQDRSDGRRSVGSHRSKYGVPPFSPSISMNSSDSNSGVELVDYCLSQDSRGINMSPDGGILSNNSVQPCWRSNYRGDYKDQNLKPICTQDLLCWAWQVARGMEYLSSRNVLHGDLAARNILLADDNIVKICDFGLAKNMYKDDNYKKKGEGPLPIKWMAIESIRDRIFSTQSDVWSFGIVLWELFTLARTPYPGLEAERQYDRLLEGYRMEKPEYATKEIYDFMLDCWHAEPSERPSFTELVEDIGNLLSEPVKVRYFDLNTPYVNMNTEAVQNGQSDYLTMMSAPSHNYYNSHPPAVVEMHGDSAYVSMNRVKQSSQSGVSTPVRSDLGETHFDFPSYNQNASTDLDSTNRDEAAVPILTTENPHRKPANVQPVKTPDFTDHGEERNQNETESGYSNFSANSHYANLGSQSPQIFKNPVQNVNKMKSQTKNTKERSPPAINSHDDQGNGISTGETENLFKSHAGDSFSNPGYVVVSNNKFGRNK